MTTKEQYARFENVPDGSTIDRSNGRVIVWYPRGERVVVKLVAPATCPTCGQAVSYPERDMQTTDEELFF